MTTFCFYAEPIELIDPDGDRQLYAGVGEASGEDRCFIGVRDGEDHFGGIDLTRNELRQLVDVLMENLGVMDAEASS